MMKLFFSVCSILILCSGCLTQSPDELIFKATEPTADLLHKVYLKSVEFHSLIDNKFYEVYSNLSRVILDVNTNAVITLIKGIEKIDTMRSQVTSFLDSRQTSNKECVGKVKSKMDKILLKIGTKISGCADLAVQQIEVIKNKKIELGDDILEMSEMMLSGALTGISEYFSSGEWFDEPVIMNEEINQAIEEATHDIYEEIIPNIMQELLDIRREALDVPGSIDKCVNNIMLKLNNVVGDTAKLADRCNSE